MVQLCQEIKDFVSRADVAKVLATVNPNGLLNIGLEGTTHVFDDGSLAYAELVGKHHFQNVGSNPHVAIACVDFTNRQGFRFVGEAEIHESGEVYDQVLRRIPPAVKPRAAVLVRVQGVYALRGPQVGERIL